MAIENKRMQQRYGTYEQFQNDRTNLLPNEFASVVSGDENTVSGRGLYFNFGTNAANRILTDEDKQELEANQMTVDTDTTTVEFNVNNPKIIYVNAVVDNVKGIVITIADNSVQFFIGSNGIIKYRSQNGVDTYGSWQSFGKLAITNANKGRADYIPSIKAVVDYIATIVTTLETALGRKENTVNKVSSMPESPTTAQYLSAMAVKLYVEGKGYLTSNDIRDKEDTSNKVTSISKNSTDTQYASAKCVYDNTINKIELVNVTDYISIADMSNFTDQTKFYHFFCEDVSIDEECTLQFIWGGEVAEGPSGEVYPNSTQIIITGTGRVLKRTSDDEGIWGNLIEMESTSNKVTRITGNEGVAEYPTALAVKAYVDATTIVEDGAITTEKLGSGAVTSEKLASNSVTLAKLHSGVIDSTLSTQGAAEAKATGIKIKADAALVAGESLITASLLEPYNVTFTNVEYTTTANKTLMADGTIIDFNPSGVSNVVELTPDTLYECNCSGVGGGGAYFFLYDKKDNISAIYPAITTDSKNFVFKASNKFKKIQFNVRGSDCYLRAITLNGLEVENNFIELTNHILDTVDYTRLNISFIESKRIDNKGVVQDYAGGGTAWTVSNEIDISQYDYLKINARTGWGDAFFAVYDENHSPIHVEVSPNSGISVFNNNVILPENAHYLVISKLGEAFDAYVSYPEFEAPTKKWEGKKWVCIGDSLTEANSATSKHYFDYIADETGITTANYGIGGTGYANPSGTAGNFTARMASVPTDADVYTIFGSFNDYQYSFNNDIPIGTPEDNGTSTICGYINSAFDALFARVPLANLGVVAPCPWVSVNSVTGGTRAKTFAENYVSALKQCCERKSIPFLDLYHGSGLRPWDSNFRDLTYTKDTLHGVHPDETGHAILAPKFSAFLDLLL